MLFLWVGPTLVVVSLFLNLVLAKQTLWARLAIFILGLLGVFISVLQSYEDRALIWTPLSDSQIEAIERPVIVTQPTKPTMTIQYLDTNAKGLAVSFQRLFSDVGFHPKLLPDPRLSPDWSMLSK